MKIPRIMLAAPASGSGKTLITCGLLQAFKNRGVHPVSFKCGPDYIDPLFHTQVLGIPSRNLDSYFTGRELTKALFCKNAAQADLAVMEGVMGFYDGVAGITTQASSWELADITDTPVILVVNMRGMSRSVVALIRGFLQMEKKSHICGVILNQTSEVMCEDLRPLIEENCKIPVLGYVPKVAECVIESRHLGLVTPTEMTDLQERIEKLAEILEKTLDLDKILTVAAGASMLQEQKMEDFYPELQVATEENCKESGKEQNQSQGEHPVRIGVARDEAFCFYYEDNLDLLRAMGAQIVPFSPLHDAKLPENLHGLLIGGGYPELYAKQLSENETMKESFRRQIEAGMPYLAECGGFMYLHETMEDMKRERWQMVGVLPGHAFYTGKLGRFGYVELTAQKEQILGEAGETIRAHEFHYFDSSENGDAFRAQKPRRKRGWDCMQASETHAAGFPHLYYYSNPAFAANFVKACRNWEQETWQHGGRSMTLEETIHRIRPVDQKAKEDAKEHWDGLGKPLGSLGRLEDVIIQIAGIQRTPQIHIENKALVLMCADNGVVEEGVTQCGQEVTASVAENFLDEKSCVAIMCKRAGAGIFPVDIGMAVDTPRVEKRKIAYGTKNMTKEPAMTRAQAVAAIEAGIAKAQELKNLGYELLATGEMGIGNTTTSSAMTAVFLGMEPEMVTGRGAGLSGDGLKRKVQAIRRAIFLHEPDASDPLDVLSKVGGFDIAGMCGLFLGGAALQMPVIMDGFISQVAALTAVRLVPECADYILASHVSQEPGADILLHALQKEAFLTCEMRLGEGSGAVAIFPLLDFASDIYHKMSTFAQIEVEAYQPLD